MYLQKKFADPKKKNNSAELTDRNFSRVFFRNLDVEREEPHDGTIVSGVVNMWIFRQGQIEFFAKLAEKFGDVSDKK